MLTKSLLPLAAALTLAAPAAAAEPVEAPSGVEFGLRTGFGLPLGSIAKGAKMSDTITGRIPIWGDIGYRFARHFYVGAYGEIAPVVVDEGAICKGVSDCSKAGGAVFRLGVNAHYHFLPTNVIDPWVGLGVGLEGFGTTFKSGDIETNSTYAGWEYALLQVGADYRVHRHFGIGPFATASFGQYQSRTVEVDGDETESGSINDKAMHTWLTFGVRGVFDL